MKIRTTFIILFLTGINYCFSQTVYNTEKKDSTNIYFKSLKTYCQTIDKTKLIDNTVYVERNYLITEKLPDSLNGLKISYLDLRELKKMIKQNGGELTLVRIIPLRVKKDTFFVNVIPFSATYTKGKIYYGNGGGLSVIFSFDEESNGLIFKEFKWGWI
jgi:hypothetical protein